MTIEVDSKMIVLCGSGAGVTEIFDTMLATDDWRSLRRNACRLLSARGRTEAASILEEFPFDLRRGTNYFQDEFSVLYAVVPLEKYIELEELKSSSGLLFRVIAETISEIGPYTRFVVATLESDDGPAPVPPPSPQITSEAVEIALSDAEHLIKTKGPISAVDRVHTALHGYLRVVLDQAAIPYEKDTPITKLFKLLRENHPDLKSMGTRSEEIWHIINTTASIVQSLNVLRNNASIAHANEALLEPAEAMLSINAARTLLHYLDSKIG